MDVSRLNDKINYNHIKTDIKLEQLITSLKFISTLKPGTKACWKTQTIIFKDSWYGAFYRYWNNENRVNLIKKLKSIVIDVRGILHQCSHNQLDQLQGELIRAIPGIKSLLQTYIDDQNTVSKLYEILDEFIHLIDDITWLNVIVTPESNNKYITEIQCPTLNDILSAEVNQPFETVDLTDSLPYFSLVS